MINSIAQSKMKYKNLLILVFVILTMSGCSFGPKIAEDLLSNVKRNNEPLVDNAVKIDVDINAAINNHEKIDESVKESLKFALEKANIFGADSSRSYKIHANILNASQAPMSFGSFEGTLTIQYKLFNENNEIIIDESINTIAGSDIYYLAGAKRHRRARAVNISKNVLQFVDILKVQLKKH